MIHIKKLKSVLSGYPYQPIRYNLLDHKEVQKAKKKFFANKQRTLKLKVKFILKETKFTIVQGCKDLWQDLKWILKLYQNKPRTQFTGYQKAVSWRITTDLMKFVPYSVLLAIPLAQMFIPALVWIFPNAIPSFFMFDTAEDQRIEKLQMLQEQSYQILIQKLLGVLRQTCQQQQFTHYDYFKKDFFSVIDELNEKLNYQRFSSDQLLTVLRFMGSDFMTGTASINKIVNLFTMGLPRFMLKSGRFVYSKLTKKQLSPYKDPFFVRGNFKILQLNYFPFEYFKKNFLLFQINRKFKIIKEQDQAFYEYAMDDIVGYDIKQFARQRGMPALSCYDTLKNVVQNDWVMITTHPKFNNNTKLWYGVMLYHFLKETNKDLN